MLNDQLPLNEQLLTLNEARKELPGSVGLSTITRWALKGLRISGCENRIKLPTVVVRRVRYTTRQGLADFLTQLGNAQPEESLSRKSPERRQPVQSPPTEAELKSAGLI